jgi:hypothetical protein
MENNSSNHTQENRFQILRLLTGYRRADRQGNQQETTSTLSISDENELITLILNRERRQEQPQELSTLERRIRRRRNNNLNNSRLVTDDESDDDSILVNNFDYDFRTYPLSINWKDIHSYENDSCKE